MGTTAVDKRGESVREMFSQIAPRYDLMNHLLSLGIDISWRKFALSKLRLDRDLPVLDCCTGTGDLALLIAKRGAGRFRVVGSDFCAPMLDVARKKQVTHPRGPSVDFVEADAQNLPFSDGEFQAVTVAFGLRNVQDTDRGLSELVRVCAKGGQVAVLEFSRPKLFGFRQIYDFYFKHILPKIGQSFAKNNREAYEYLPKSVQEFPSGKELADRMEKAGLQNLKFYPLTFGVATLYLGDRPT